MCYGIYRSTESWSFTFGRKPKPKPKVDSVINASLSEPTSHSTRCRRRQHSQLPRLSLHSQSVHSEANDSLRLAHPLPPQLKLCTYFRQPLNLPTEARRNRKWTECGTTAFGRHRMSAESAHLSTFGAETETEAEIRSTSTTDQQLADGVTGSAIRDARSGSDKIQYGS